jgi:hypothetical protein
MNALLDLCAQEALELHREPNGCFRHGRQYSQCRPRLTSSLVVAKLFLGLSIVPIVRTYCVYGRLLAH